MRTYAISLEMLNGNLKFHNCELNEGRHRKEYNERVLNDISKVTERV